MVSSVHIWIYPHGFSFDPGLDEILLATSGMSSLMERPEGDRWVVAGSSKVKELEGLKGISMESLLVKDSTELEVLLEDSSEESLAEAMGREDL